MPNEHIWPSGCSIIFEQHFDSRGEHVGQVMETMPDARYYTGGTKEFVHMIAIRGKSDEMLALVNFDKVLIILPILTVGPGAA